MNNTILLIYIVILTSITFMQTSLSTARPGSGNDVNSLNPLSLQIESGMSNSNTIFNHNHLIRLGILPFFEFHSSYSQNLSREMDLIGYNLMTGLSINPDYNNNNSNINYAIITDAVFPQEIDAKWLEHTTFVLYVPISTNYYQNLFFQFTGDYMAGRETYQFKPMLTLSVSGNIDPKSNWFAEIYTLSEQGYLNYPILAGGATYLINNNFQLDISIGTALYEDGNNRFIDCGLSYRLID